MINEMKEIGKGYKSMKQSEISGWLKGITIAIGIVGVVFFFLLVPILAGEMKREYPQAAFLYLPGMAYSYVIAAGCYAILYQFWTVCREIGRDNSFSKENAAALSHLVWKAYELKQENELTI